MIILNISSDNDEGDLRLESGEQGPVVADEGTNHLHVAEHADQHQQHREQRNIEFHPYVQKLRKRRSFIQK